MAIGVTPVGVALVRAWTRRLARDKDLRHDAGATAEWQQAVRVYAERERDKQLALHGFELTFYKVVPGGKVRKVESPPPKVIESPQIADTAS